VTDAAKTEIELKHEERAKGAIARHLCSSWLTDGFCGPGRGKCIGQEGERPAHRNCWKR
jgi:hypothetical protein